MDQNPFLFRARGLTIGQPIMLALFLILLISPNLAQAQWATSGNNINNTNSGNVGIGTSTPTSKLHVGGNLTVNGNAAASGSAAEMGFILNNTTAAGRQWLISSSGTGSPVPSAFRIFDVTGGVDRLVINSSGNVGIGTTTPGTKLDISDSGNTTLDLITARRGVDNDGEYTGILFGSTITNFSGALRYILGSAGAGRVGLYAGDNAGNSLGERLSILSNGNIGIGTTAPGTKLDISDSGDTTLDLITARRGVDNDGEYTGILFGSTITNFSGALRYILGSAGAGRVGLYAGDNAGNSLGERLSILSNGNIGIGTTGPTNKLDVRGSVGIGGGVNYGNGLTITSINPSAANHITTFQGPASGTNDTFSFELNRGGGAYGSFDISGNGATFVHFPMASLTAPGWINTPGDFYFNSGGNVGIGTSTPSTKLHVVGDVTVTGNIAAKYQDVAEWVPSSTPLTAGMVVVLDKQRSNQVLPSLKSYDTTVAGVVSDQPGIILGEAGEGKAMVATTGRVKVRVDASKKGIQVGDLLVTSDKEGIAMKSEPLDLGGVPIHRPGTLIGKALEPLKEGEGEILVLLSLQ